MQCFRFPAYIISDLESMIANYWWGSTKEKRKPHWSSWATLCKAKAERGLGFRRLEHFNSALLMKQAWRLVSEPGSVLAEAYKAKYFPDTKFWDASLGSSPSYTWTSILSCNAIGNNRWDEDIIRHVLLPCEAELVLNLPFPQVGEPDVCVWSASPDGKFSVRSAYELICKWSKENKEHSSTGRAPSKCWGNIWKWKVPQKIRRRGMVVDSYCKLCGLFQSCSFTMEVYRLLQIPDLVEYGVHKFQRTFSVMDDMSVEYMVSKEQGAARGADSTAQ
ncbi:hypothetical protein LIER_16972 [Lithospermum erythrorhizon]|uniref:Uncharacterized protein n=1 Tax=Lithospermum erythrorhizon TaxID=34254 RepID=A0AAV3QD04_LITER